MDLESEYTMQNELIVMAIMPYFWANDEFVQKCQVLGSKLTNSQNEWRRRKTQGFGPPLMQWTRREFHSRSYYGLNLGT